MSEIDFIHSERDRLAERLKTETRPGIRQYMMFQRDSLLVRLNELLNAPKGT